MSGDRSVTSHLSNGSHSSAGDFRYEVTKEMDKKYATIMWAAYLISLNQKGQDRIMHNPAFEDGMNMVPYFNEPFRDYANHPELKERDFNISQESALHYVDEEYVSSPLLVIRTLRNLNKEGLDRLASLLAELTTLSYGFKST